MLSNLLRKRTLSAFALSGALAVAAIACGTDNNGAPAAGGNGDSSDPTPPPSTAQSGYDAVRQALEANGALVVNASTSESGGDAEDGAEQATLFDASLINVLVNGEQVTIYVFATEADALDASGNISADGTMVSNDDGPTVAIDYLTLPHLFLQGNVIVIYAGTDSFVTQLLRDTFGTEFAGDRSPITQDGDLDTVVVPAPIESVEVVEDADNPGFFLLNVSSGLPNGCASFHDVSVQQTGELELTLTVLNNVPAPDQMIACTEEYRIVENTVPLGSGQDNLDLCEVYTVRWDSRGNSQFYRFQVTSPEVRCMTPEVPLGPSEPVVEPIIADFDALVRALTGAGFVPILNNGKPGELFGFPSDMLTVNGERVDVYSYGSGERALIAASGVSPDGSEITLGPNGPVMSFMWVSTPHYYLFGTSIVVYVGVNGEITAVLDQVAGHKFAGPDSKPVELPDDDDPLPLPVDGDRVKVEAPIVNVGEIAIAESFPVQYFIQVRSAQPNGCVQDAGWDVTVVGNDVIVTVLNTEPADLSVVSCIQLYGETEHTVRLGADEFVSGQEYNLIINRQPYGTFTAQ